MILSTHQRRTLLALVAIVFAVFLIGPALLFSWIAPGLLYLLLALLVGAIVLSIIPLVIKRH